MDEGSRRRGARPPRPPSHLDENARNIWRRVAAELWVRGSFEEASRDLVARYCEVSALAGQTWKALSGGRVLMKGRRETLVTNPLWRIYRDAVTLQIALARELGFHAPTNSRPAREGNG